MIRCPVRGSITRPSGSKLRPSVWAFPLSARGLSPFIAQGLPTLGFVGAGSRPKGSVSLIVCLILNREIAPVFLSILIVKR
jgi:hypothetical protein